MVQADRLVQSRGGGLDLVKKTGNNAGTVWWVNIAIVNNVVVLFKEGRDFQKRLEQALYLATYVNKLTLPAQATPSQGGEGT